MNPALAVSLSAFPL